MYLCYKFVNIYSLACFNEQQLVEYGFGLLLAMGFGKNIKFERKKNNLSTEELAALCGVSRSYITLIENGKRLPGKKVLLKLAVAFKLPPHDLVNWYLEALREKIPLQPFND